MHLDFFSFCITSPVVDAGLWPNANGDFHFVKCYTCFCKLEWCLFMLGNNRGKIIAVFLSLSV